MAPDQKSSVNHGGPEGDHTAGLGRVSTNLKVNSLVTEHGTRDTPGNLRKHEKPSSSLLLGIGTVAGINHSKVWESNTKDTDNLQTTDNLLQLENKKTKPDRKRGSSQPTHQLKSLGGGTVPSPEDILVGACPRWDLVSTRDTGVV